MNWQASRIVCPQNGAINYQYESYTDPLLQHLAYRSGWLSNTFIPAPGTPEGTYYWHVRAKDSFGNQSEFSSASKLVVDRTVPLSIIINPVNSANNHADLSITSWDGKIEGTASDSLSGLDRVEISIQKNLNEFWNGTNWISGSENTVRVETTGTTNWNYQISGSVPSGSYRIVSHAVDKAGNIENSATIEFENSVPESPPETTPTPTPTEVIVPTNTPTPAEIITPTNTPVPTETLAPTAAPVPTITVNLSSNRTNNKISLKITNISSPVDYEITYTGNGMEKGINGHISQEEIIDSKYSKDFYLGTCTTGGSCTPEVVENESVIIVDLIGDKTTSKTFNY